jgi:hypothetical protein
LSSCARWMVKSLGITGIAERKSYMVSCEAIRTYTALYSIIWSRELLPIIIITTKR